MENVSVEVFDKEVFITLNILYISVIKENKL